MAVEDPLTTAETAPARAIIDIGSNTVRLVIYGGPRRAPAVLHNEKVTVRLGKAVVESGALSRKAATLALATLARYQTLLRLRGVKDVQCVATAAVRDASNGAEFVARVADLGLSPRLLTGAEEATAGAMGVIGSFPGAEGVVADLGGGSLELVDVAGGTCSHAVSLPLGTLRLPGLRAAGERGFAKTVKAMIEGSSWRAPPSSTLYVVGGSFRPLARVALEQVSWPSDDPHGFELSAAVAAATARRTLTMTPEALTAMDGVSASRAASLPHAAALLLSLIRVTGASRVIFSAWGLREGLLYTALEPDEQAQDPLVEGMAVQAARHGIARTTAVAVADWTAPAATAKPEDAGLRLGATLLALSLSTLEPNLRPEAAQNWSLRKRWIGISNRQRAMLATCLLANAGRPMIPRELRALASDEDLREAQGWGLAIRLCRRFSGSSAEALAASRLSVERHSLFLTVDGPLAALVNEAAQRDLRALAAARGLTGKVAERGAAVA